MATAIFEGSGKRTVHGVFTADLGPTDGTSLCWTKLFRAFTATLADLNLSADGQGPRVLRPPVLEIPKRSLERTLSLTHKRKRHFKASMADCCAVLLL